MKPVTGKVLKTVMFLVLACIVMVVFILLRQSRQFSIAASDIAHTNEVLYHNQKLLIATVDHETPLRDFIITGNKNSLLNITRADSIVLAEAAIMRSLTADNPVQQVRIDALLKLISENNSSTQQLIEQRVRQRTPSGFDEAAVNTIAQHENAFRQIAAQMENEENNLLVIRKKTHEHSQAELAFVLIVLVVIVLVLILIMARSVRFDFLVLKKTEKELGEKNQQFNLLVKNVNDYSILMVDPNGNVMSWNEGTARIEGYSADEIMGKPISIFYTDEQIKRGEPLINLDIAKKSGRFETEGVRVRKDGSLFWANVVYTSLYDDEQGLSGFLKITKDITEQKKKQEEISYLSNLVEQTSDAIFSVDLTTTVKSWNRAAEKMYGYSRAEAIGKNLTVLLKSQIGEEERKHAMESLNTKGYYRNEYKYRTKDGKDIFVLSSVTTLNSEQDKVTGYVTIHRDITQRKMLEDQLKKFNEELEEKVHSKTVELTNVFERITDAFIALDKNWCYTYANKATGELIHRDPEKLIGKNVWQEFPDVVGSPTYEVFQTALKEQHYMHNEDYYEPLDLWQENYVYPSPEGISVFIKNITERKKAELQVRASEEKYRKAQAIGKMGHWELDLHTKKLKWSDEIYKIFELEENEFNGDEKSLLNMIHNEDRESFLKVYSEALAGEHKIDIVHRIVTKGGTIRYTHDIGEVALNDKGEAISINGTLQDITEQVNAQQEIVKEKNLSDSIINSLPGAFYLYTTEGKFLRWNKNFERITMYSGDEIRQMRPTDFFDTDEQEYLQSRINRVFEHGISDAEANFLTKNKKKIPYYFTGIAIPYEGQTCLMGVGIDISERVEAQKKIKQTSEQLRELAAHLQDIREEERATMAMEIHDELGQQLTGLKMDIFWLRDELKNPSNETIPSQIENIIQLLDATINTVRKISSELRPPMLDDFGLVETLIWYAKEFQKRYNIEVQFKAEAENMVLPPKTSIALFRIFQESLTNVARHAHAKKVVATLKNEDDYLILHIADDGKGFDGSETAKKRTLGLLGMKERILMLNGDFQITSRPGIGTEVRAGVHLNINKEIIV